jgi:ABC-type transport system involved in Fe-S cluster assembly fused permease/ATPase subunit
METIRYGGIESSGEEAMAAAKLASASHFSRRLPQGYKRCWPSAAKT